MLFDKLCKVAEREIPELIPILRKSKLFHFPGAPHKFLPKEVDDEIIKFLNSQFMLPFKNVAVEDDGGLVIFEDYIENIRGIDLERRFIDITRMQTDDSAYGGIIGKEENTLKKIVDDAGLMIHDPLIISIGAIERVDWMSSDNFLALGRLERVITAFVKPHKGKHIYSDNNIGKLKYMSPDLAYKHTKSAIQNAMTALQEILYTNSPNKFIVQISPTKKKFRKKGPKIDRSDYRNKYILLTPKEIRSVIGGTESGTNTKKSAHERRAHPRTFHSDRFIHMKGKTIMIPAVWIGESEKIIGNKRYKIMLEM